MGPTVRRTDRRRAGRPGRYRSMYVHGYRSLSPIPIVAALGAIVAVPALIVAVLTVTHAHDPSQTSDTRPVVTSTVAPVQRAPAPPPPPCYPFQPC